MSNIIKRNVPGFIGMLFLLSLSWSGLYAAGTSGNSSLGVSPCPLTSALETPITTSEIKLAIKNDFNGDRKSDVFWRNEVTRNNLIYQMTGNLISSQANVDLFGFTMLGSGSQSWEVVGSGDFNEDGKGDLFWRSLASGQNKISLMNGTGTPDVITLTNSALADVKWKVAGIGDFDGDGDHDIFWHHDDGENRITFMNGTSQISTLVVNTISDPLWEVVGIADFNQDGKDDVLWQHDQNKHVWMYLMNGSAISNGGGAGEHVVYAAANWSIEGLGDFNADGKGDLLWRNSDNGRVWMFLMNGRSISNQTVINSLAVPGEHVAFTDLAWEIKAIGDYNGDGRADVFWRHSTFGWNHMYLMNGVTPTQQLNVTSLPDLNWKLRSN